MDERGLSMFKTKIRGAVQDVIFPDFPDDDNTTTTTVTKSRRVSFGSNFVKEFIVGSAVSAQCVSEYEQAFSSSDSSNANSSHSAVDSGILNRNTYILEESHKMSAPIDTEENRNKRPKISSTICFSADSPTDDMEFTEGCISLAKHILDKKNREMTVIIQAKPKDSKDEAKPSKEEVKSSRVEETQYFEGSNFDMSMTKCFKSKYDQKVEKKYQLEKTRIFNKFEDEMSFTRCDQVLTVRQSNVPNDDESDQGWAKDDCKENQIPLDLIMRHLDKDDSDIDKFLFSPEKTLSDVLKGNIFESSGEPEKLNLNESMDISRDFQPNFLKNLHSVSPDTKNPEDESSTQIEGTGEEVEKEVSPEKETNSLDDLMIRGRASNFEKQSTMEKNSKDQVDSSEKLNGSVEKIIDNGDKIEENVSVQIEAPEVGESVEKITSNEDKIEESMSAQIESPEVDEKIVEMSLTKIVTEQNESGKMLPQDEKINEDVDNNAVDMSLTKVRPGGLAIGSDDTEVGESVEKITSNDYKIEESVSVQIETPEIDEKITLNEDKIEESVSVQIETPEVDEKITSNEDKIEESVSVQIETPEVDEKIIEMSLTKIVTEQNESEKMLPQDEKMNEDADNNAMDMSLTKVRPGGLAMDSNDPPEMEETNPDVDRRDEPMEETNANVGRRDESMEETNADVGRRDKPMEETNLDVGRRDEPMEETNANVGRRDEFMEETNTDIGRRNEPMEETNANVRRRDESMEETNTDVNRRNEPMEETNANVRRRDESMEETNTDVNRRNESMEETNTDIGRRNEPMEETNANVRRRDESMEETNTDVNRRNEPMEETNAEDVGRRHEPMEEREEVSLCRSEISASDFLELADDLLENPEHEESTPAEQPQQNQTVNDNQPRLTLMDTKIIENLKEQSKEPGCIWKFKDIHHPTSQTLGFLEFSFELLESSMSVKFSVKSSEENTIDACCTVSNNEVYMDEETQFRLPEYNLVVGFGFEKLEKNFKDESKSVKTIRHVPYFLDQMNIFALKMNACLQQVLSILTLYPGSRLLGSILSFRLFSFPVFFSCTVSIDLTDLYRLSTSSLSFDVDLGSLDKNKIRNIFQECLKCDNSLCEFVIQSTKYIIGLEKETGYVSKRGHIRLLPSDCR